LFECLIMPGPFILKIGYKDDQMDIKLSSSEYMLLVEKAPIMIWRSDLTMGCDYFNEVWLNFTGRTLEQEFGNGWTDGVHPEDFDQCLQIYADHFSRKLPFEMEYRLRRSDGVYRWISDRGVPFHDADGKFRGYIGSCIDITDSREARDYLQKLQENEIENLRKLLPICAYCKRIRDDKNYWNQIETYISKHSKIIFSHGICPECEARVLDEIENR
jgi:PAS domain S-box-containing protein